MCRSKVNGTELAPLQGPTVVAELVDTVLDAWAMLKWSTKYPSNPFAIQVKSGQRTVQIYIHLWGISFDACQVSSGHFGVTDVGELDRWMVKYCIHKCC